MTDDEAAKLDAAWTRFQARMDQILASLAETNRLMDEHLRKVRLRDARDVWGT